MSTNEIEKEFHPEFMRSPPGIGKKIPTAPLQVIFFNPEISDLRDTVFRKLIFCTIIEPST